VCRAEPTFDLDPEQVTDRVLILDPIEPPQHRPALLRPAGLFGGHVARANPVGKLASLALGRPRFLLRRHLPRGDAFGDEQPLLTSLRIREIGRQLIETKIALGLLAAMALQA
jgi:hypothetical protein